MVDSSLDWLSWSCDSGPELVGSVTGEREGGSGGGGGREGGSAGGVEREGGSGGGGGREGGSGGGGGREGGSGEGGEREGEVGERGMTGRVMVSVFLVLSNLAVPLF